MAILGGKCLSIPLGPGYPYGKQLRVYLGDVGALLLRSGAH